MDEPIPSDQRLQAVVAGARAAALAIGAAALYALSRHNYLLFHGLVEIFAVFVAWATFTFAWNTRHHLRSGPWLLLGVAYLSVGLLQALHALAYSGMGVFPGTGANLATELWIAARYLESLSLLAAAIWLQRPARPGPLLAVYGPVTAAVLAAIFYWDAFPDCYVEGQGLTAFKVASEYVVVAILLTAGAVIARRRRHLAGAVLRLVLAAIATSAAGELSFTLYSDPYGLFNLVGHLFAVLSFFLLYLAVLRTGLRTPQAMYAAADHDRAIAALREALWAMRSTADFERVLRILHAELRERGVPVSNLGINLLDDAEHPRRYWQYGLYGDARFVISQERDATDSTVIRIWSEQRPVLRPDLEAEDAYGELLGLRHSGAGTRCVVDVPMPFGTLAMSSDRPRAFTAAHVDLLADLASAIAVGAQRLTDLERLEQANRDLADQMAARQRLEQELVRAEGRRLTSQLSTGVSHNFNNLLTGILGPAHIVRQRADDPAIQRQADAIVRAGTRARDLVQRLARSANPSMASSPPQSPIRLNEHVAAALDRTRRSWQAGRPTGAALADVVLRFDDVPDVAATPADIDEIVGNLVANAFEAMPNGGTVTVSTEAYSTGDVNAVAAPGGARICVADSGPGLAAEDRSRVFEPFYTTKAQVGCGLGLSAVQAVAEGLGGTVSVDSALGRGATFSVELPSAPVRATQAASGQAVDTPPGTDGANLLVVAESDADALLVHHLLAHTRRVEVVRAAADALARLVPTYYHAVLIGLGLTSMPADRLARQLRQVDPALATVLLVPACLAAGDTRLQPFDLQLAGSPPDAAVVSEAIARALAIHGSRP